jgi:outer membrane protein OmpA-like peptidoglycan-associated protein
VKYIVLICVAYLFLGCTKKVIKYDALPTPQKQTAIAEDTAPVPTILTEPIPVQQESGLILFGFNSTELDPVARTVIRTIIRGRTTGKALLIGGACPIGSEDYNRSLGLRRAQAVASAIGPRWRVTCESVGEDNLVTSDPERYAENRRCEIMLLE